MSDNIPFDIQMEIIKRVSDVRSLIRLRSVSKQWKSFVDSFEFIACYGARRSQPHHLLLRYKEANELDNRDSEPVNQEISSYCCSLCAQVLHLSKTTRVGFRICPSTYDPTIVIISHSYGYLEKKDTDMWQVGIFTLSSKTWKMTPISNLPCESIRLEPSTQVAIHRFIFRVAYDTIAANDGVLQYKYLILSFNLITHEFKE
nr:hypothetical protein [Tanacetum cinerariifolium]